MAKKPGTRAQEILQALARMLEHSGVDELPLRHWPLKWAFLKRLSIDTSPVKPVCMRG